MSVRDGEHASDTDLHFYIRGLYFPLIGRLYLYSTYPSDNQELQLLDQAAKDS